MAHLPDLSPETVAVVAGRPPREQGEPVNLPLVLTSTYFSRGAPEPGAKLYARWDTETWNPLEGAVAELEGATEPGLLFGSGMAAIAAVLSLVPAGGKVVAPRHSYQGTLGLLDELARAGTDVVLVDVADTDAVLAVLEDTDLLWIESPTNPMLEVADVPTLVTAAHAAGALVAVDNTFATPLLQRPLAWGADLIVHSVTKYLSGHSDVILGIVVTSDTELRARLQQHRTLHGSIAGPFEAWLALRGLRTLGLRVERSERSARELAARLAAHPGVVEVRHPSLPGDPGHERASALMSGYGSIIGLRPAGGAAGADAVVERLRLWLPATSLGGVESSVERRRRLASEPHSVPEDFLRLSVGVEDAGDLWRDLDQALRP